MKIYAITRGDYSDYHICALTIDKSKAEKLKLLYTDCFEEAEIEEYEDGEDYDTNLPWLCRADGTSPMITNIFNENDPEKPIVNEKGEIVGAYVRAEDPSHAEKKAQDLIAKYRAEREGIC